jgi:hypothetical protein
MIVFKENKLNSCFVHIPKNSGTWINKQIKENYEVVKFFWNNDKNTNLRFGYEGYLDRAHIPIDIFEKYFFKDHIQKYYCLVRNPYQRLISAFNYRTKRYRFPMESETFFAFKAFVKTKLKRNDPNQPSFRKHGFGVHYLSQHLFIRNCNKEKINVYKVEEASSVALNVDKQKFRSNSHPLHLYYDEETIKIVNEKYYEDFIKFGYNIIT